MNLMVGRSSGGGGRWNRPVSQVQGRGAGSAMVSLPPFRSRAHLAKTAGLQGAGRTTGFSKAAAELRGPPGHLKGGAFGGLHCYASKGSEPASDALDEPCSSSTRAHFGKHPTPAVRLQGVHEPTSSSLRAHRRKPAEPAVRLQGVDDDEPTSSSLRSHFARAAEPVSTLQSAGRRMGFGKVRGLPGHLKGGALGGLPSCYAFRGSEPASDALDEPRSSHRARLIKLPTPAVMLQGVHEPSSSFLRSHLARPAEPVATLQCAGGRMGFGKVWGSPGYLKGGALGDLLTCYASGSELPSFLDDPSGSSLQDKPSSSLLDEPSALHAKLDLLHDKIDRFHEKLEYKRGLLWRIIYDVVSFVSVLLMTTLLYMVGRSYLQAELNKMAKAIFFSFVNDDEVKQSLQELIQLSIDTSFYHISSLKTWYRWLRGRR